MHRHAKTVDSSKVVVRETPDSVKYVIINIITSPLLRIRPTSLAESFLPSALTLRECSLLSVLLGHFTLHMFKPISTRLY